MPVPIKSKEDINTTIDYSFLFSMPTETENNKNVKVAASNKDASLLFEVWCKSLKENDRFYKIDSSISSNDLMRLKAKGFIVGNGNKIEFTKKGKMILTTMALGEQNKFENKRQNKSYNEILASMDKRGKKGYRIPKFATNNSNNIRLS